MLQSNGFGNFSSNRGVFLGAGGGTFNTVTGDFVLNGVISGPGKLHRVTGSRSFGAINLNADNNTFASVEQVGGMTFFNGNSSAGLGTINLMPETQITIGKNEGPDNTIPNPIQLGAGAAIDIRVTVGTSASVGSIYENLPIGNLTLSGKISGPGRLFKGLGTTVPLGDGKVILTNSANDFTGDFTIALGTVEVTASGALGATSGATMVINPGTLAFNNVTYTAPERLFVSGRGLSDQGALRGVAGTSRFAGPVVMTADTSIGVDTGATLELNGGIRGAAGLNKVGPGTLRLSSAANDIRGDVANSEGRLEFGATHRIQGGLDMKPATETAINGNQLLNVKKLTGNTTADFKLDLGGGRLVVDYDPNDGSPIQQIRSWIESSFFNGGGTAWAGPGITSSIINTPGNLDKAIGYGEASVVSTNGEWDGEPVDDSAVVTRFTVAGDIDLDGEVAFPDLLKVSTNYGKTNVIWTDGDVDYDGEVTFFDLLAVSANYGKAVPAALLATLPDDQQALIESAFAQVPEPGSMSLLALGAAAMLGRRRRAK
jgi:autotransporter-associated beta strand protein